MAEKPAEPTFARLVFGRAVSDTARFLGYTRRDLVLGTIGLILGAVCAYKFVGKADTMSELAYIVAFTLAPGGLILFAVFGWHLWLAPSVLAYEAATARTITVRPPRSARLTDNDTVSMAGIVRQFCENACKSDFEWPPRDMGFGYSANKVIFESSHPIWTNAEINTLRRRLNSLFYEMSKLWSKIDPKVARSNEQTEELRKCFTSIDEVGQELSRRLIDG
jgi:hypothetical protein